jgi:5-oxoprolinase (ATP-hydrolysing) subunit B
MREFFLESNDQARLISFADTVRAWPHVREAVAGAGNCTVLFDDASDECTADALTRAWAAASGSRAAARTIEIPVQYNGDDLDAVAYACGLSRDAVIAAHSAATYHVAFIGFQPGFAYLDGLDERLRLPRRAQPRTRVPAGSVAIAGSQSAVYPFASPGGWHLLGRTGVAMFEPLREPASLLQPGDAVRFVPQ